MQYNISSIQLDISLPFPEPFQPFCIRLAAYNFPGVLSILPLLEPSWTQPSQIAYSCGAASCNLFQKLGQNWENKNHTLLNKASKFVSMAKLVEYSEIVQKLSEPKTWKYRQTSLLVKNAASLSRINPPSPFQTPVSLVPKLRQNFELSIELWKILVKSNLGLLGGIFSQALNSFPASPKNSRSQSPFSLTRGVPLESSR